MQVTAEGSVGAEVEISTSEEHQDNQHSIFLYDPPGNPHNSLVEEKESSDEDFLSSGSKAHGLDESGMSYKCFI